MKNNIVFFGDLGGTFFRIKIIKFYFDKIDKQKLISKKIFEKKLESKKINDLNKFLIDIIKNNENKFNIKINSIYLDFPTSVNNKNKIYISKLNLVFDKNVIEKNLNKKIFIYNDVEAFSYNYLNSNLTTIINIGTGLGITFIKNKQIIKTEIGHLELNYYKSKLIRKWEDLVSGEGIDKLILENKLNIKKEQFLRIKKYREIYFKNFEFVINEILKIFIETNKIILTGGVINNNLDIFEKFIKNIENNINKKFKKENLFNKKSVKIIINKKYKDNISGLKKIYLSNVK
jgi:predicted NBD/HSP70 family sugar kinase